MGSEQIVPRVIEAERRESVAPEVVTLAAPRCAAAEQYRVLARRIEPHLGAGLRRIGVTSAVAGEGRSTTAVNLALSLALARRQRVALVDAHLRAPSVERLLGLPASAGLAEIVAGSAAAADALRRYRGEELHVLGAGAIGEPHATLSSPRAAEVLGDLAARFDAVIVDAPPILPAADLLSILPALDALVVVTQAARTPRELVLRALAVLGEARVLGVVLHRVESGVGAQWPLFARHDRDERARAGSISALPPSQAAAEATQG